MRFKSAFCARCNTERVRVKRRCTVCGDPLLLPSKYKNIPTRGLDGKMKQSRKEARRGDVLLALYRAGKITELFPDPDDPKSRQLEFRLDLYANDAVEALIARIEGLEPDDITRRLIRDIQLSRTKICSYRADYRYLVVETGEVVVEDVKGGYISPEYRIKKKLMALAHNIEIEET